MWRIIILCAALGLAAAQRATFENYKVFRITPITQEQIDVLRQLEEMSDGFSFWESPSYVGDHADLMVAPHKLPEFYEMVTRFEMPYNISIDNVQTLIDTVTPKESPTTLFDFNNYHTLDKIYKNLDHLAARYPDKVQIIVGGKTYEGRQIKGVKVSFKPNNPGVFIEGGIHAREWISPATVMYILHQLLISKNADVRAMAESHDWYIFPMFNPDGYVHTHTKDRLWRKTRMPSSHFCTGADLNRNWDYKWLTTGASSNPCSNTYAGSAPFSEIEARSMSEYIRSISDKFYVYLSFHSYTQRLMFHYGYTKKHLENYEESYAIGLKSIQALKQRYGTEYTTGNIAETIYMVSGCTVDYIKGVYHKPLTYTYELRDRGYYGFLLPPSQIIPSGKETLDSLVAMFKEAKARDIPKR